MPGAGPALGDAWCMHGLSISLLKSYITGALSTLCIISLTARGGVVYRQLEILGGFRSSLDGKWSIWLIVLFENRQATANSLFMEPHRQSQGCHSESSDSSYWYKICVEAVMRDSGVIDIL